MTEAVPGEAMTSSEPVDVLVIGGGIAGLCAAIEAAQAGAAVRLLEAAPYAWRGGNSRHSRNLRLAHDDETPWQPGRYTAAEFAAELRAAAGAASDTALTELLCSESAGLAAWLASHGVVFQPIAGGLLPWSRKTAFFLGGGKAMVNSLYASAAAHGVAIDYECTVPALTPDDGAAGVRIDVAAGSPAGERRFTAGAVVVASGGYPANRDWLRERWGEAADRFANRGSPYLRGELLRSLLAAGALPVGVPGDCHLVAVDARAPQEDAGIVSRVDGMPWGIVVDGDGRRFHDEGENLGPIRYSYWGQRIARHPGQRAWLLLDADAVTQLPPLLYPPLTAPTIGALATRIGLDAATLQATIDGYEAARRCDGKDDIKAANCPGLLPPRSRHAAPLSRPPFAAIPMQPGVSFTCFGVGVNRSARLLRADGGALQRAFPRVFAAGMIMAPAILGSAYLSGAALTISAVFGRIAGRNAAALARGTRR